MKARLVYLLVFALLFAYAFSVMKPLGMSDGGTL